MFNELNAHYFFHSKIFFNLSEPGFISEITIKEIGTSSVVITWPPPVSDLWTVDGYMVSGKPF